MVAEALEMVEIEGWKEDGKGRGEFASQPRAGFAIPQATLVVRCRCCRHLQMHGSEAARPLSMCSVPDRP